MDKVCLHDLMVKNIMEIDKIILWKDLELKNILINLNMLESFQRIREQDKENIYGYTFLFKKINFHNQLNKNYKIGVMGICIKENSQIMRRLIQAFLKINLIKLKYN